MISQKNNLFTLTSIILFHSVIKHKTDQENNTKTSLNLQNYESQRL